MYEIGWAFKKLNTFNCEDKMVERILKEDKEKLLLVNSKYETKLLSSLKFENLVLLI